MCPRFSVPRRTMKLRIFEYYPDRLRVNEQAETEIEVKKDLYSAFLNLG